ncbi:MAG: GNAT family N-acetyltransferase [Armatimonadetes bacterium]|nr:GNAT family N-acetyltransferase [Armatimonadota bacterium]
MLIQPLTRAHDRSGFDCGNESLNRYLRELARQDAGRDLGITFVAVGGPGETRILGYYMLTMSKVNPLGVPDKSLPPARDVPVALLGRLAVDRGSQGQGVGERLLFDGLFRIQQIASQMGSFAVVVDALDQAAARFYAKYGFKPLNDDPLHLYLSMKEARKMGLRPHGIEGS